MPSERLGKGETSSFHSPHLELLFHILFIEAYSVHIVFVTGNAGKLREVREILAQGTPVEIESRDLDRE